MPNRNTMQPVERWDEAGVPTYSVQHAGQRVDHKAFGVWSKVEAARKGPVVQRGRKNGHVVKGGTLRMEQRHKRGTKSLAAEVLSHWEAF